MRGWLRVDTVIIQPSQIARLERDMPRKDISIFAHYPNFVGSIDFLKSERHCAAFLRDAPDLIIVDEAHIANRPRSTSGIQHQRYELLRDLSGRTRPDRAFFNEIQGLKSLSGFSVVRESLTAR
jgi:hypothetical protein